MNARAKLNYLRMSPRKVRLLADLLRGRSVPEAHAQLAAAVRGAAAPLSKLLASAVANARRGASLDEASLYVAEIRVDGGPSLKRSRPRSRGMVHPVARRTSHVTMVLGERTLTVRRRPGVAPQPDAARVAADTSASVQPERERHTLREAAREGRPTPRRGRIGDLGRRIFRRKAI